jgi:uncharacterized RDD family membrane protein YckC
VVVANVTEFCPRCGTQNLAQSLFCNNCRLYLRDDAQYVERATYNRRFWGDYLLEGILFVLTLVIGWFIWFIFTSKTGQTPAKRLLNVYVVNVETGRGIGRGDSWLREIVVKVLVLGVINSFTSGLAGLIDAVWIFFDKNRQTLHDKVLKQVVVYAPAGLPEAMQHMDYAPAVYQAPPIIPSQTASAAPPSTAGVQSIAEELRELARLRDEGMITAEEYEAKRAALVNRM